MPQDHTYPQLRAVDVQPSRAQRQAVELTDRSGMAEGTLTVSNATLSILSMMTGRNRRADIQAQFMRKFGRMLFSDELDELIEQLDQAYFLAGPRFEAHWETMTNQYRASPLRRMRDAGALGAPIPRLASFLDTILDQLPQTVQRTGGSRVAGLIAPHLDYERGAPCYAAAYADLTKRTRASRFVILGTNHFGRSTGVVGTKKDFETPWGPAPHDAAFMNRLDRRCRVELCEHEYDHAREHSIELQVIILKHALGDRPFTIAPYLCPDPCGPTGTQPRDGHGVDLRAFALALRAEIAGDDVPTCVVAGADLSHVGRFFHDDHDLDDAYLAHLKSSDLAAIHHVSAADPETLRSHIAATSNATNICSTGCIYALATALNGRAAPHFLHYHQALVPQSQNCVTCAAIEYIV